MYTIWQSPEITIAKAKAKRHPVKSQVPVSPTQGQSYISCFQQEFWSMNNWESVNHTPHTDTHINTHLLQYNTERPQTTVTHTLNSWFHCQISLIQQWAFTSTTKTIDNLHHITLTLLPVIEESLLKKCSKGLHSHIWLPTFTETEASTPDYYLYWPTVKYVKPF